MKKDFPNRYRLKKEKEIKAVFARRDFFRGKRLIFYRAENETGRGEGTEKYARFGIIVPRRCGQAVKRNRIKRVIRQIVRENLFRIVTGYDYVIRVDPDTAAEDKIKQDFFLGDFEHYFKWN